MGRKITVTQSYPDLRTPTREGGVDKTGKSGHHRTAGTCDSIVRSHRRVLTETPSSERRQTWDTGPKVTGPGRTVSRDIRRLQVTRV